MSSDVTGAVRPDVPVVPDSGNWRDRYFRTDHLLADIKGRAYRGGAVTLSAQGIKFALNLCSTAALARLLTPQDFGLVAMVTAITGFLKMFKDAGLSMATVQRAQITHEQVSTLFWINIGLSVFLAFVTVLLAPIIVWFYGEPRLAGITVAVALTFIFSGAALQHEALIRRQMRYLNLAANEIISMASGITVAVAVAFITRSYWALVALPITTAAVSAICIWATCRWIPGPPRRGTGVRPMLLFGGHLTVANFLAHFRRNLDNVLLGYFWGSAALGLYSRAYGLLALPISQINQPISRVAVPSLCRMAQSPAVFREHYRVIVELISLLGFASTCFLILEADFLVLFVLGDKWVEAVPIFRALGPASMMGSLNIAAGMVFVSTGRTDKQLWSTLFTTPVVVIAFFIGLPWGPIGMATAFSVAYCAIRPPTILYAMKGTSLKPVDLVLSLWRPTVVTSVLVLTWLLGHAIGLPILVRVALYPFVLPTVYFLLPGNLVRNNLQTLKELNIPFFRSRT
jgi:PST family polysaccharide transporter